MSNFRHCSEAGPSQVSSSQVEYPDRLTDYDLLSLDLTHEPLTPDHLISQQALNLTAPSVNSESYLITTTTAPDLLERIGPGAKPWVRYTKMNKIQFIEWWRHTSGA